jgi:hypothetical protein
VSKNMAKFGSNLSIPGLAIALCLGVGIIAARHWLSEPKAASSQSTVLGANSMLQMKQAIANHLQPTVGVNLDPEAAAYLAGAKAQVLSQSNRSARLLFTFSDGATAEENITLQPDQPYSPSPVEFAAAAMNGSQVYNVKFSSAADGADKLQLTLQYWVPYTSLSPDVQQAIRMQTAAGFFQLVPEAHAQPGMAGVGVGIVFGVGKQAGGAAIGIWSAMGKKGQNQQWMNQLAALQNCVHNPTNPVTQSAYAQNPAYQQQTLSGIQNAQSSVQQVTAARFLAQLNATAGGLVGGPFGLALGGLTYLNDTALQDVANQEILDAAKNVPQCQPPNQQQPASGKFSPMMGNFRYDYNRGGKTCNKDVGSGNGTTQPGCNIFSETRTAKGTFSIVTDQFGLPGGSGTGTYNAVSDSHVDITKASWHTAVSGDVQAELQCGGTPTAGYIRLNAKGDSLQLDETGTGPRGENLPATHSRTGNWGVLCEFHNINFETGGTYSTFGADDPHGTCTLTLQPQ